MTANESRVQPTVLIAGEDTNAATATETLRRTRGLSVRMARDGIEAREIAGRERLAAVVLDLDLPAMNGLDLIRHLSGRFEGIARHPSLHIIVFTSMRKPELGRFAVRLGASTILRKPVSPARLIHTIQQCTRAPGASDERTRCGVSVKDQPAPELDGDARGGRR